MTAYTRLKRTAIRVGRWSAASRVTRTVTALTGLQGRFHRRYWRYRFAASDGRCAQTLDGTTVHFRTATPEEYRHCATLMGERDLLREVCERVEPGDVFFDVGAYLGVYSCFVAAAEPSAEAVAFEPDPHRLGRLSRTVAANGLGVTVRGTVLSDATGSVPFATDRSADGPNVSRIATDAREDTIERPVRRGDALVGRGEVPAPTVVKIDVEGAELDALRGMDAVLRRPACRLVYCEVHPTLLPDYDATEGDVRALLDDAGFAVTRLDERGEEYFLRAEREPA